MVDIVYQMSSMTISEALVLLTEFVKAYPEDASVLRRLRLRQNQDYMTIIELRAPSISRMEVRRFRERRAVQRLCALYTEKHGQPVAVVPDDDQADFKPLAASLPNLLQQYSDATTPPRSTSLVEGEKLLIARNLNSDEITRIFHDLRIYSTHTRLAAAQANGQVYYLYHIRDDMERFSAFNAMRAGGQWEQCEILDTYQVQPSGIDSAYKLFLPTGLPPNYENMAYIAALMIAAPELFGALPGSSPRYEKLGALSVEGGSEALLFIANLSFLSEAELVKAKPFRTYEVVALHDAKETLSQLRAAIEKQGVETGYKIELRQSHTRGLTQEAYNREFAQVLGQLQELQQRKADLQSLGEKRPRLLRFTERDLPALVDIIRQIQPADLNRVRYAFHPAGAQADGLEKAVALHFLYIEPDVLLHGLNPLIDHETEDNPIEYWLDPTWARSYFNTSNQALVFVPKGRLLYPSFHSWNRDKGDMDNYLRDMLKDQIEIPAKPIYIFDIDRSQQREIVIYAIGEDQFRPINDPACIRWLNDNLLYLSRCRELEKFIRHRASDLRRETFAAHSEARASQAESAFEEAAQKAAQQMTDVTDELLTLLDDEFNRIIQFGEKMIEAAVPLSERLNEVEGLYQEIKRLTTTTESEIARMRAAVNTTQSDTMKLAQDVQDTIGKADATAAEQEAAIHAKVDELKKHYDDLKRKIDELKGKR